MNKDLNKLAREIVEKNQYATLGTGMGGEAWVSPVVYANDDDYCFYWISLPNSKHSLNIKKNKKITFSIFDSHQNFGEGVGLQIEGFAEELNLKEYPKAFKLYFKRIWPYGKFSINHKKVFKKLLEGNIYRFYKVIPTKVWMNDPREETDVRVEVKLL